MPTSAVIHLFLHALVPLVVARIFYPGDWVRKYLIMLAAMVIDIDHLLAVPIYDPQRCGVGFHPLHGPLAVVGYTALTVFPYTRVFALGLLIHIALDSVDCQITNSVWYAR